MPEPLMPLPVESPTTDDFVVGEPDPITNPSLDDPNPDAVETDGTSEGAALPTSEDEPSPLDQPIYVGSESKGFTVLAYVRDTADDEMLLHFIITAAGEKTLPLTALGVELLLPDTAPVPLELPARDLEPGDTWEADVAVKTVGFDDFTPGTAMMCYSFSRQPDLFAYV